MVSFCVFSSLHSFGMPQLFHKHAANEFLLWTSVAKRKRRKCSIHVAYAEKWKQTIRFGWCVRYEMGHVQRQDRLFFSVCLLLCTYTPAFKRESKRRTALESQHYEHRHISNISTVWISLWWEKKVRARFYALDNVSLQQNCVWQVEIVHLNLCKMPFNMQRCEDRKIEVKRKQCAANKLDSVMHLQSRLTQLMRLIACPEHGNENHGLGGWINAINRHKLSIKYFQFRVGTIFNSKTAEHTLVSSCWRPLRQHFA